MNAALPARLAIAVGVGLAVAVSNDPLAGLVIGFMLAQVLIVYPKYQVTQREAVAARRNRGAKPDHATIAAQTARRAKLLRYLLTQFVALGVVLLAASGMVEQKAAVYVALPVLAALTWLQLQILE